MLTIYNIHPNYTFQKEDFPYIVRLATYFLNDEEKCKELEIDLDKGILLTGPIGYMVPFNATHYGHRTKILLHDMQRCIIRIHQRRI
ncbi:hypothetical protein OBK28_09405 [Empedobacter falsenii]